MALCSNAIAQHTLTLGSVGKSFNATGWRVGYVVGPPTLIQYVQWSHALLCYVTSGPAQAAAVAGFQETSEAERFWAENELHIKKNVDKFCMFLDIMGLPYVKPSAAYFVYVNVSRVQLPQGDFFPQDVARKPPDWQFCWWLINVLGVSCIPGSAFYSEGQSQLSGTYVRFTVCKTDEDLDVAIERLRGLNAYMQE
ncbi:MAG: hypothetical protein Q9162_005144 [Coniocarpon cinnabarinum]